MDYNKLNLSKLQFEIVQEPPHISVKYDNKNLVINTPKVTIPFGIDEVYDKFYTKKYNAPYGKIFNEDYFFDPIDISVKTF